MRSKQSLTTIPPRWMQNDPSPPMESSFWGVVIGNTADYIQLMGMAKGGGTADSAFAVDIGGEG
jgi:hypothetical protein